jgi:type I restriction enzyme S subunit
MAIDTTIKIGYKQTELGEIPEDWEERVFKSIYSESSRNGIYKTSEFQGHGTRIVNMGEMFGIEFISDQEMSRVALTSKELALSGLQNGDLLFGRRSVVPAGAGKCSIVVALHEPLTFESSIIRVRLNLGEVNPLFYYYFFASQAGRAVMSAIVSGTNIKGIRASELKELKVPIPTKAEQTAIATVLSDTDALIARLEKLLAKKKAIKQGTMQQLLTGKKRLPGFNGEWEVKKLGEVCRITTGKKDVNEGNPSGAFPFFTCSRSYTYSDVYSFDEEAILVAGNGEVGNLHYYRGKFEAYQRTYVLVNFTTDVKYLWYQLDGYLVDSLSIGKIGSSIPYIKMENLFDFKFQRPTIKEEQKAITQVLSDMDAEIEILEQKRDKYTMLKQGMMQQLLTGKIRIYANN